MSWPRLLLYALLTLIYLRSPIDLLPDRIGPIGLIDDLLLLGWMLWWARRQLSPRPQPPASPPPPRGEEDAYAVLGVARDASSDEITRAYREQMKRYHPDRVAGLGEELQQLAHDKTIAIQRAYEQLSGS